MSAHETLRQRVEAVHSKVYRAPLDYKDDKAVQLGVAMVKADLAKALSAPLPVRGELRGKLIEVFDRPLHGDPEKIIALVDKVMSLLPEESGLAQALRFFCFAYLEFTQDPLTPTGRQTLDAAYQGARLALASSPAPESGLREAALTVVHVYGDETKQHPAEALQRAIARLEKALAAPRSPEPPGWISVKEKHPRMGQQVLLFANGVVQEEVFTFDQGDDGPAYWDSPNDVSEGWPIKDGDMWMPLPPPPVVPLTEKEETGV